jgi:L-alanine-DL-glutamate epimerase-like enolase superfamily enzyme
VSCAPTPEAPIEEVRSWAWTVPTDRPESDGTLEWGSTTLVLVEVRAGGSTGTGYTYGHWAVADIVDSGISGVLHGHDAMHPGRCWTRMRRAVRNNGHAGLAAMAVSAVDIALWDLKSRLLEVPLSTALDAVRETVPVYGSGGFTTYTESELTTQLTGWAKQGIPRVKMKVGRDAEADPARVRAVRDALGDGVELYADANGGYTRKQALAMAERLAESGVTWLEEPVSSDDLAGLRLLRDRGPAGMDIAAGEYGYQLPYFERMLSEGAVDCLQADVTRCGGISGFLRVAALCDAHSLDLSAHGAPQVSAHACTAAWHLRHLEYFHDHARIEAMLFDSTLEPGPGGVLRPDSSLPGHGLVPRPERMQSYRVR